MIVRRRTTAYHEHNAAQMRPKVLAKLREGVLRVMKSSPEDWAYLPQVVEAVSSVERCGQAALAELERFLARPLPPKPQLSTLDTRHIKDIVNAMLYLTSPAASFVTGETLKVGGGFTLGMG